MKGSSDDYEGCIPYSPLLLCVTFKYKEEKNLFLFCFIKLNLKLIKGLTYDLMDNIFTVK